jgi:hypothetical protein
MIVAAFVTGLITIGFGLILIWPVTVVWIALDAAPGPAMTYPMPGLLPAQMSHVVTRAGHDLEASAILLNRSGRVRSDADLVFYNQPAAPDGAVRHTATTPGGATSTETLHIATDNLSPDVPRIVAAVSVDGGRFFAPTSTTSSSPPPQPARPPSTFSSPPRPWKPRSSARDLPPRRNLAPPRRRARLRRRPGRARPRLRRRRRLTPTRHRTGVDQLLPRMAGHSLFAPRSAPRHPQPAVHGPPTHPRPFDHRATRSGRQTRPRSPAAANGAQLRRTAPNCAQLRPTALNCADCAELR